MQVQWFNHLPKDEQEQFKQQVHGCKKVLDRLGEICYTMRVESKSTDYDSPSWAFKQADANGYNRAIEDIVKFLDVASRDNT